MTLLFVMLVRFCLGAEITLGEAEISGFLKQKESWTAKEITIREWQLSPDKGKKFRIYVSSLTCGRGVCPQYLWQKTQSNRWQFLGMIPGPVIITADVADNYYILESQSNMGASEKHVEKFQMVNGQYQVMKSEGGL